MTNKKFLSAEVLKKAAQTVAKKIKLEEPLYNEMGNLFEDIAHYAGSHYLQTGRLPDLSRFKREIEGVLRRHYERVQSIFSQDLRTSKSYIDWKRLRTKARDDVGDDDLNDAEDFLRNSTRGMASLQMALEGFQDKESTKVAAIINETNNRELEEALQAAIDYWEEQEILPSDEQISDMLEDNFLQRAEGRSQNIAVTETEKASENAKYNENLFIDHEVEPEERLRRVKSWTGMLDDRERAWHVEAEGQTVPVDEPFEVMGEKLLYPGDDSFGVSPENICNCRCGVEYSFEEI